MSETIRTLTVDDVPAAVSGIREELHRYFGPHF